MKKRGREPLRLELASSRSRASGGQPAVDHQRDSEHEKAKDDEARNHADECASAISTLARKPNSSRSNQQSVTLNRSSI